MAKEILDVIDVESTVEDVEEKKEIAVAEQKAELTEVKETDLSNPFTNLQSFKELGTIAAKLAQSTMIPESYQGNPANVLIALDQAQRLNCSPLLVMQQLYVVKGKPSWSGSAASMIVNGCGKFKNVKLNYVGTEGKDDFGAYVSAIRISDGEELIGTTIDMKMVKAEGWDKNPKWRSMPRQMAGYRAYTFFARLYCANELSGFATQGEIEDIEANKKQRKELNNPFN